MDVNNINDYISGLGNSFSGNTLAKQSLQSALNASGTDFTSALSSVLDTGKQSLEDIFNKASQEYGVPTNLLKAIAKAESNFNPDATSSCGAQGIMQLMPSTAKGLGVTDAYDPTQNIMGGARQISDLLKKYNGNTELALAAYNAGSGNVAKYGGVPPFKETQNYVKKVMEYAGENIDVSGYSVDNDIYDAMLNMMGTKGTSNDFLSQISSGLNSADFSTLSGMNGMSTFSTNATGDTSSDSIADMQQMLFLNMIQSNLQNSLNIMTVKEKDDESIY